MSIPVVTLSWLQEQLNAPKTNHPYLLYQLDTQHLPDFERYRMEVFFIAILHCGSLTVESDLQEYQIAAPALFAMGPSVIRRFVHASDNFRSEVIFFDKSFILQSLSDPTYLDQFLFLYQKKNHLMRLSEERYQTFCGYLDLIRKRASHPTGHSEPVVRNLIQAILYEIADLQDAETSMIQYTYHESVFHTFQENLEKYFTIHHLVKHYAYRQNLSSKYFSGVIQKQSGKPASALINERICLEATALLQDKTLTIQNIAERLGFSDASNFRKFFKTQKGIAPKFYRRNL